MVIGGVSLIFNFGDHQFCTAAFSAFNRPTMDKG
jgi:hypothetical protein